MEWMTIVFGISTLALGGLSAWYQRQSTRLQSNLIALEAAVDEIKKFDGATAKNFLAQARMLDHESWEVNEGFKRYVRKVSPPDVEIQKLGIQLATMVGGVHQLALTNFRTMVRVYQLSGNPITHDLVDRWIRDGFVPEHYRAFMLSQAK